MPDNKNNSIFQKIISPDLIIIISLSLGFLFIPLIISFLWGEIETINFDHKIDHSKFGTFGDFFGGVVGSMWSLGGILLFYFALREQRKDFKTNEKALREQIKALNLQSEEFKLQREELSQSREVFTEQSKTIKQQRLESTYFALIELYNKIITTLDSHTESKNYFKDFRNEFEKAIDNLDQTYTPNEIYINLFYLKKEDMSHYFKIVYRIIKLIEESEINEDEKFKYVKILRSQLSENEMLAIYYNSHSNEGGEFYKLILKYNLLKHLPTLSKGNFRKFLKDTNDENKAEILMFNNFAYRYIHDFLFELNKKVREDDFEILEKSEATSKEGSLILELKSSEINELTIIISYTNKKSGLGPFDFEITDFESYIKEFIIDMFISSTYHRMENFTFDVSSENNSIGINNFTLNLTSKNKLELNSDKGN